MAMAVQLEMMKAAFGDSAEEKRGQDGRECRSRTGSA